MIYPTICHCVVLYWVYLIAYQAVGVGKEQILEQKTKKRRRRRNTKPRKLLAGARRPKVQLLDIHSRRLQVACVGAAGCAVTQRQ